ncbi:MAG: DUF4864 domain-containing protein [Pseudomonadota bacterium]
MPHPLSPHRTRGRAIAVRRDEAETTRAIRVAGNHLLLALGALLALAISGAAAAALAQSTTGVPSAGNADEGATDPRSKGIRAAISKQLTAFKKADADTAWSIAAPTIQSKFESKERFMRMVRTYYPQVHNARSVIFKGLRDIDGTLVQKVFIDGGPGDYVDAYYSMRLIDGVWRITGVFMQKTKAGDA